MRKETQYWRVSSNNMRSIQLALQAKTWGVSYRGKNTIRQMSKGDKIVIYLTRTASFVAICQVSKEFFFDSSFIWEVDDYPHRIGIEPLLVPKKPLKLEKARKDAERPNLGGSFGRTTVVRLTSEDFDLILNMMTTAESSRD